MRNSPYLDLPLRSEAEAQRQLRLDSPAAARLPASLPVHSSHARYLRELERIRNASQQVRT